MCITILITFQKLIDDMDNKKTNLKKQTEKINKKPLKKKPKEKRLNETIEFGWKRCNNGMVSWIYTTTRSDPLQVCNTANVDYFERKKW